MSGSLYPVDELHQLLKLLVLGADVHHLLDVCRRNQLARGASRGRFIVRVLGLNEGN